MSFARCDECMFFEEFWEQDDGSAEGICKRFPPVYVKADTNLFDDEFSSPPLQFDDPREWRQPIVLGYQGCGEFRKKEKKQ